MGAREQARLRARTIRAQEVARPALAGALGRPAVALWRGAANDLYRAGLLDVKGRVLCGRGGWGGRNAASVGR